MSEKFDPEKPFFRSVEDGKGGWRKEHFGVEDLEKVWNGEDLEEIEEEDDSEHS